jgi:2-polyprenyl-3-methyl-5-hydroxy-6-metoxy-1,4-benzoquinol methylase
MAAEPWFKIGEAHGLRFLKEQLKGLDDLPKWVSRAKVLDLGCAEGLIGKHCIDTLGADLVHGLEILPDRIKRAQALTEGYDNARFWVANLNNLPEVEKTIGAELPEKYDVVLALAILHKLKDPAGVMRWAAARCSRTFVVRMPGYHDFFEDHRSKGARIEPDKILTGWKRASDKQGPRNERTLIYTPKS